MEKVEELKHIIEILPVLRKRMDDAELIYLRQQNTQWGFQENGYVYNVQPSIESNYHTSRNEYNEADKLRWELIKSLNLSCSVNGIPDFCDSGIKPYGHNSHERDYLGDCNSPIGLP